MIFLPLLVPALEAFFVGMAGAAGAAVGVRLVSKLADDDGEVSDETE